MNSPRLTYSPKLTLSPRLSQLRKYHISDKLQNFHGKVRFDFVFIHVAHKMRLIKNMKTRLLKDTKGSLNAANIEKASTVNF